MPVAENGGAGGPLSLDGMTARSAHHHVANATSQATLRFERVLTCRPMRRSGGASKGNRAITEHSRAPHGAHIRAVQPGLLTLALRLLHAIMSARFCHERDLPVHVCACMQEGLILAVLIASESAESLLKLLKRAD